MNAPQNNAEHRLVLTRTFQAPMDLVWAAWTQREHLLHWLCPKDFNVLFAELDLRPGGAWRSGMQSPDGTEYIAGGVYHEVQPHERLVFTHTWEQNDLEPSVQTRVTVTLTEKDGHTEMTFQQEGLATIESRDSHKAGWSEAFDNLHRHVAAASTT